MTDRLLEICFFLLALIVCLNISLLAVVVCGIRSIKRYILECHAKTYCNLEDKLTDSKSAMSKYQETVLAVMNEKFDDILNKLYDSRKELLDNILISSIQSTKPSFSQRKDNVPAEKKDNVSVLMQISTNTNWNEIRSETNLKVLFRKYSSYFNDYEYLENLLFKDRKQSDLADIHRFTTRTENCLRRMSIYNLYHLLIKSPEEVAGTRLVGRKCFQEINEKLQAIGCHLGMKNSEIFEAFIHYFN